MTSEKELVKDGKELGPDNDVECCGCGRMFGKDWKDSWWEFRFNLGQYWPVDEWE